MLFTEVIPNVCCVYKITNTKNNLILIGSTINLNHRINHYRNDINKNNPLKHYNKRLYDDIIKYGIESFVVDIIEEFDNIDNITLKNKESEYIVKYNSIDSTIGYNLRLDINGKYICNDKTRELKSQQLKEQWANGIRNNHSDKMIDNWLNAGEGRRMQQANIMRKNLTKYYYNIYDANMKLLESNLTYGDLKLKSLHNVQAIFKTKCKNIVWFKHRYIERVRINN